MTSEVKQDAEEVLEEAARGRASHTPFTMHGIVVLVIGLVVALVTAVVLPLYLFL